MVLEMVLESLFAVVDVFWVGRLGAAAVATVGLTESMLSLVFAVGLGLSMSTTAMVARRVGERNHEGASTAAVQAIWIGLAVSAVIGLPCYLLASRLLRAMGASREIVLVRFLALRGLPRDPNLRWVAERALYDPSSQVSEMAREILSELDAANVQPSAPAASQSKPPDE
jgi:hypothetical protein